MSEEVKKRVEALRKEKEDELYAAECKKNDELIQWEAEMVIDLDDYTNERIMNDLTDDMDIYECLSIVIRKINCYKLIKVHLRHTSYSDAQFIKQNISCEHHSEIVFKMKYLYKHITSIKESPGYLEKEKIRKEKIAEDLRVIKQQKEHQERVDRAKKEEEECIRIQKIVDEANAKIKIILGENPSKTFTEITLEDWKLRSNKAFLIDHSKGLYHNNYWSHWAFDMNKNLFQPCFTGMPSSFESYYEEGKVPFFTKCPTCKSPTKFNYLNKSHAGSGNLPSNTFNIVYCVNHYFYNSDNNTHYKCNPLGKLITHKDLNLPDPGQWSYNIWVPSNNTNISSPIQHVPSNASKWIEWDPSDPDGAKAAAFKKQKEVDEIQKQISQLHAKLESLQA